MKILFKAYNYFKVKLIKNFFLKSDASNEKKFNLIYNTNYWSDNESVSGSGSKKSQTSNAINGIKNVIDKYNVKTIFDAPCGDFNWIGQLLIDSELSKKQHLNYIGGDIVNDLILELKKKYTKKNVNFNKFDISLDIFPKADLFICRDCLIHFSNNDIEKTIKNFLKSEIEYILVTDSIVDENFENYDIKTGEFRKLDLTKKPFNFPQKNLLQFNDVFNNKENAYETKMTLWSRDQLKNILSI